MKTIIVRCVCDTCGRQEFIPATFNEYHDAYESTLPVGWEYIDNADFEWLDISGDQCDECVESYRKYIQEASNKWKDFRNASGATKIVGI